MRGTDLKGILLSTKGLNTQHSFLLHLLDMKSLWYRWTLSQLERWNLSETRLDPETQLSVYTSFLSWVQEVCGYECMHVWEFMCL